MKKLYIPKDYQGRVLGVFLANNKDLVDAFQMGTGSIPHSIEEIDLTDPQLDMIPIVTLITSFEKRGYDLKDSETYVFVKRGS